jgi:hypothetical protein
MFFKRMKKNLKSEYAQRQFYMMSNLGLFYLILIALFAVPLLGAFVVVLIMGVNDYRHLILLTGLLGGSLVLYLVGRSGLRFLRKVRDDGLASFREANRKSQDGAGMVQIAMFKGLLSFTVSSGQSEKGTAPELPAGEAPLALLEAPDQNRPSPFPPDPVSQIRELKEMLQDGTIDESEFRDLKEAVIRNAQSLPPAAAESAPPLNFESEAYMAEELSDIDPQSRYSN